MLRISLLAIVLLSGIAAAQISVVTTQPDLADIARRVGGDAVKVVSLTKGHEDLHLVRIKPSMLLKVRRADVFVQLGFSAEHSWAVSYTHLTLPTSSWV